jgi:hypothetical protein
VAETNLKIAGLYFKLKLTAFSSPCELLSTIETSTVLSRHPTALVTLTVRPCADAAFVEV